MTRELSFWKRNGTLSGYIRAVQIAHYLGAKINPTEGFENDVCVFVKWTPAIPMWGKLYLDVVDRHQCIKYLSRNTHCGVIAISKTAVEYLHEQLPKSEIVFIPQQHVNYERSIRRDREVKVVGYCGEYHTFEPFEKDFKEKLNELGLELKFCHNYKNRFDVINFYESIDIQLVYRVEPGYIKMLKNPLKLSNAGSFRIPTVAQTEENFVREYDGCFLPANSIDEAIKQIKRLKEDKFLYEDMASKAQERSENYHIENVVKYYKGLLDV